MKKHWNWTIAPLACTLLCWIGSDGWAQCQRGGGSQSSAMTASAVNPYTLNSLQNGYTQNSLGANNYQQIAMLAAYQRQQMLATQVAMARAAQAAAENVRYQTEFAKAMSLEVARNSAAKRKEAEEKAQQAAELREERLAARRVKKERPSSSSSIETRKFASTN